MKKNVKKKDKPVKGTTKAVKPLACAEDVPDHHVPLSERVTATNRKLRKEIEEAGLARYANDLYKLKMASIRLYAKAVSDESKLKPGCSKLGGIPDLPEGVAWPDYKGVPMAFLAQFRMQEVAPEDPDGRLPESGMLYFFYETNEERRGIFDTYDRWQWRVIYYDGELKELRPTIPPDRLPEENRLRACKLLYSLEMMLPVCDSPSVRRLKLSEDEELQEMSIGSKGTPLHRLLGHPDQLQTDMQFECQLVSQGVNYRMLNWLNDPRIPIWEKEAEDWQLLLQIDSDVDNLGAMWGDVGMVYFWIRKQDLNKRDFSNVWVILQCH